MAYLSRMKPHLRLLFFLLLFSVHSVAQEPLRLLSWNIQDFGRTKDSSEIRAIAQVVADYDVVAIQEVVAGYGGAQAVARLADQLNRLGERWDYRVSDPTDSPKYKTERYAFLWKTGRVQLRGRPWLAGSLPEAVFREPYLVRFRFGEHGLLIANYHARRHDEAPEEEIALLAELPALYPGDCFLLAGDFNRSEEHPVFDALERQGYRPAILGQPTTLKHYCDDRGNYLNHAIDNVYLPGGCLPATRAGVLDLVEDCTRLEEVRRWSDHLPVWVEIAW